MANGTRLSSRKAKDDGDGTRSSGRKAKDDGDGIRSSSRKAEDDGGGTRSSSRKAKNDGDGTRSTSRKTKDDGDGTRSSSRKAKDDGDNDLKGSQNRGKKSVNSGAATAEASGVRRSPRETVSKKNMTPPSSSGTRKSERLEKQTANLNSMTPSGKRTSERIEKKKKKKNASPLRRSNRVKMPSSSASSGSKRFDKSLDLLNTKRKKEKKKKSVKQLPGTVEDNKIEREVEQANEKQKKRMDARAYKALFRKQPKKVDETDRNEDLNGTNSGRREEDFLEEFIERSHERTEVTSTSQPVEEALKGKNEHNLFLTSEKDSCKDISSNGGDLQIPKNGLIAEEMNDNAEKAAQDNLQSPHLAKSIMPGGVLGCDISVEMVMPSENKCHDMDIDSVASPKISSNNIATCTAPGPSQSSSCKRKDCSETCGMSSKRQREKLDVGMSTGYVEKPCNYIQQRMSSADLQAGRDRNACIICRLDGKLLCCCGKGCQRSYHLSCLEPPLEEFPLGAWYCLACVRKKLESGIYSVSKGIEAIWDSRELEASEDGLQRQKQYFVKYEGLAHVHNRWLSEDQVLLEAPSLVAKYNQRNQGSVWKQQWVVPHRLLQKRLLMFPRECDEHHNKEHNGDKLNCHVEWLVKWCGLGYEHASWEFENASFFSCPGGQNLIQEYETRKKAQKASKFDKERAVASLKISQLPAAVSSGLDANLDAVNKLCNYWRRGQNAIIFDDQERISNVISSILAFPCDISSPFLIISTSASQYSWDEEFLHLAPSADIVVYSGSKEVRDSIRNLEFYDEGGCIMFQVLITSPEVISEDFNLLSCIGWEAIIVDECQRPRITSCFEQIKILTSNKRLLIISSQLKDNVVEYLNLFSLLDSQSGSNGSESLLTDSSDDIDTLKERLAKYVVYERKLESSRFLEYWVPVLLSNVQLEKYCFTLISNSLSLCSPSKSDPVGVLRNILISNRKCCDHPYTVDQSLQLLLTKGLREVEFLDVGIKASGKLQLLDAMLCEIKKRELKVLILFQYIGGSGRDLMGDILDDFLRQRFGIDSYERVDGGVTPSKKQSALNRFNNEKQRFVFLLETRACLSSIKLSTVGTVIIFGSDWSPMNDLRALQRITLDSQLEQIKVFRLYSSFTVEEKLLMLSKQDKTIDSNIEYISPSSSHMLLKWGASYLFSQLDKFHGITIPDASILSEQSHLKYVIQEFFTILHQAGIDDDASKLSLILQAKQIQGMYRTEMPLFGVQKIQVMNEDPPHTFWTKLLEGKSPRWKYCTSSSQRNRKRVHYFEDLQKEPEAESAEVAKRRKKVVSDGNDHPSPKAVLQEGKLAAGYRKGSSGTLPYDFTPLSRSIASGSDTIHATSNSLHLDNNVSKIPALKIVEWERRKQRDSQKNLHVLLKPQIAKLCEVLHLTEDVKAMVERFLEYVMNNHLVNKEPATILQAFQISLCWSAASLLKQKLDHKESLALAKQHLGFTCKKEEADYVYSMLRCLKRMFLYRTGYLKVPSSPKASGLPGKSVGRDYSSAASYQHNIKAETEDLSDFREGSDIQAISESRLAPEIQLAQRDLLKSIKEIEKKCDKQMRKLIEKHKREVEQFNQKYEYEKAQLENKKRTEAAVIRLHSNVSMRTDKLNNLDTEYARKFDELEQQMDLHLKNLEALQVAARSNFLERKTRWVESVKSWARVELVKPPVSLANLSEGRSSAGIIHSASGSEVRPSKIVHIVNDEVMAYGDPINKARPFKDNSEVASVENLGFWEGQENLASLLAPSSQKYFDINSLRKVDGETPLRESGTIISSKGQQNFVSLEASPSAEIPEESNLRETDVQVPLREIVAVNSGEGQENLASTEALSYEETTDGAVLSNFDGEVHLRVPDIVCSGEGYENLPSVVVSSSEEVPGGTTLNMAEGELPFSRPEAIGSTEGQENIMSANCSFEKQIPGGATLNLPDGEIPRSTAVIATSCDGMDIIVCTNSSTSKEQIPDTAACSMPTKEVSLVEPETVPSEVLEEISVQRENDGTSPIENDQLDGIQCTMNCEAEFQEPSLADLSSMQPVPTSDQGGPQPPDLVSPNVGPLPYASSEAQARCMSNNEMRNASQLAETSPFNGTIDATCNMSNPDTTGVELREQMQQLRSSESTSNLSHPDLPSVTAVEHQSNNEGQTANQSSQAPTQPVANQIELSNQDVLQPLHSPIDGAVDRLVRQASETRTASVPFVSNGLPLQTEPALSSRMHPTFYHDPLQNEMERILKEKEQTAKVHEDMKLQLKLECEKEIKEVIVQIRQKYEAKLKEKEAEFLLHRTELSETYNKVLLHKILAEAFRSKCMDNRASGSAGIKKEANSNFMPQQVQLSSQQMVQQPPAASGLPSTGSASTMQTVSPAVVNAQTLQRSTASGIPSTGSASTMQIVSPAVVNAQTLQLSTASGIPSTGSASTMQTVSPAVVNAQTLQRSTASGIPSTGSASTMQTVSPAVVNAQTLQRSTASGIPSSSSTSTLQTVSLAAVNAQTLQPSTASGIPPTGSASSMQTVSPAVGNAETLQPSTASGIPSTGSATSMRTVSPALVNAQTMGPHLQVVKSSALFSGTPTRSPHISNISSTGNLKIGTEIRAPAPHLQPFRPSSSISPSSLPLHSHVNHLARRQASITGQSGRIQHEVVGGLAAPPSSFSPGANANPPGFLLPNVSSRLMPSSRSNSAQRGGGATDVVCLSDDD
ncbi:helicase protein MOM1 isoform X2 [Gossypium hirsutum]|uniref:Helicase protein MOM1 isoform X2 n=1 Tax=Gossypium hirsutum TaxID=3635 RepID=A0ABM3A3N7_GOSHI|nr:helicase protein MOM1 isoform X2 [Gossypium hirsutum]